MDIDVDPSFWAVNWGQTRDLFSELKMFQKSFYGIILVFKAHFHYNFEGPEETLSARLQYSSN